MKPELGDLLDHLSSIARELTPSALEDLEGRIRNLPNTSEAHRLVASAPTARSRQMLGELVRLWAGAPEVDPPTLSLALSSVRRATEVASRLQSLDIVWTGPETPAVPVRRTDQALYELIQTAERDLLVVSFVAYKIPRVVEALCKAVEREVDVRVVLEVGEEGGGKVSFSAFEAMGSAVPGAKLYHWPPEVRERDQHGRYGSLHAKCAVADGELALISSANLTEYALELNMELGILVRGGSVPKRVLEHFDDLMSMGILLPTRR